jgi:uncharacterized protein (UPF0262 family)
MQFVVGESLLAAYSEGRVVELQEALHDLNQAPGLTPVNPIEGEFVCRLTDLSPGGVTLALCTVETTPPPHAECRVLWSSLRTLLKDYGEVIANIVETGMNARGSRFEALDYGKKVVHDEAGEELQELLEEVMEVDLPTARRLFTLLFLLKTKLPLELVRFHRRHL